MNDKDLILRILHLDVVTEDRIGCLTLFLVGGNCQQTRWFVNYNQFLILINNISSGR